MSSAQLHLQYTIFPTFTWENYMKEKLSAKEKTPGAEVWSVSCNQNNTWLECRQFFFFFTFPVLILCSICIEARKKCEGNADQKERELKQKNFRPEKKNQKQEWPRDSQMKPKAAAAQAAVRFALKILWIKTVYRQPAQGTIWIIRQWRRELYRVAPHAMLFCIKFDVR